MNEENIETRLFRAALQKRWTHSGTDVSLGEANATANAQLAPLKTLCSKLFGVILRRD